MAKLIHNIQKKQHKERAQPQARAKFGLLEKKKDYVLRARDYHRKEALKKVLTLKSKERNKDEYYHAMTRAKTDERGIRITDRQGDEFEGSSLTSAQIQLLKTQDVGYVSTLRRSEKNKIEKEIQNVTIKGEGKHTIFVDSELEAKKFKPEEFFKTDKRLLSHSENRLRLNQLESIKIDDLDEESRNALRKEKVKKLKLLQERMKREEELKQVENRMNLTRELLKKGGVKKKVDDEGRITYKWKRERKR